MKISIVIPTLNEEKYIGNLLYDISAQTMPAEVIVVDGKSKDNTVKLVKQYPKVKRYSIPANVARQRNVGGLKATGDFILFMDADVRLPRDFLERTVVQMENKNLDICCPLYLPYKSKPLILLIYIYFNVLFFLFQHISPSGAGSCIACRKQVFLSNTGFDEGLKFDDIEMIRRYGRKFRFGIVLNRIYLSDRRFRKEGILTLMLKYMALSGLFVLGQFKLANRISYGFGNYE